MSRIQYPDLATPKAGTTRELRDGLHWLRMPLPISLNHINLWLLEDGDAWTIVDTGMHNDIATEVWNSVFETLMPRTAVSRVLATHMHPDHMGNAGWLVRETGAPLWMTREEYTLGRILVADTGREAPDEGIQFYRAAGFADAWLDKYRQMFGFFGRFVSPIPESYHRVVDGDVLQTGAYRWEIVIGNGHSPEHACLLEETQGLLIAGDQLLPGISSHVGVYPTEPDANPLADWLASLQMLKRRISNDVLVLPAHGRPFTGAQHRAQALLDEHHEGLEKLGELCAEPKRAIDVFPALFRNTVRDDHLILATSEALAHLHYLMQTGSMEKTVDHWGVAWFRSR